MPRVPTLDRQVAPGQAPGARLNAQIRPVDVGDGVRAVGGVLAQEQRQAVVNIRQTQLEELGNKRQAMINRLAYDPEGGYQNKRGKDAFSIPNDYGEAYQKGVAELETGITDPEVKRAFKLQSDGDRVAFDRGIYQHVNRERGAYDEQTFQSGLAIGQETIGQSYQDELGVDRSLTQQMQHIAAYAERNGLPAEWKTQQQDQVQSAAYSSVINRHLADGNDITAKQWFDRYGDSLSPADKMRAQKDLDFGSTRGESQRITDDLMEKGLSYADAQKEIFARTGSNPELREATEARYQKMSTLKDRAQAEEVQALGRDVYADLLNPDNPDGLDAIAPGRLSRLREEDPDTYAAMLRVEQARVAGVPIQTDLTKWQALQVMAANPATQADFVALDMNKHMGDLSTADWRDMVKLQIGIAKDANTAKTDKITKGVLTREQAMDSALRAGDIDPGNKKNDLKVDQFRQELDRQIRGIQESTGKELAPSDVRKLSDELLIKVTLKTGYDKTFLSHPLSSWFDKRQGDTEAYAFETPAVTGQVFDVAGVPEAERQEIVRELTRRGIKADGDDPSDPQKIARARAIYEAKIISGYNASLRSVNAD